MIPRPTVLGRVLAVLGVALVAVGITTLPASAHHPTVSGQADCNGRVSYTSTAWNGSSAASRTNRDVRIQAKVNGSWVEVGKGAYVPSSFSFGGSFTEPLSAFPLQLRAYAAGQWGDGAAGGSSTETTVGAPSGCQTPPTTNPKASVDHTCTAYTANLDNRGSSTPVEFSVSVNNGTPTKKTVTGTTGTITGALTSGKPYVITVSANGKQLTSSSFDTNSCGTTTGTPKASVKVDCTGYDITVANTGGGTTKLPFVVTVNGSSKTVQADSSPQHVTGPVGSGKNTFSVTQGGKPLASQDFDATTCTSTSPPTVKPAASISADCHGFVTVLDNSASSVPTTFVVTTDAGTGQAATHSIVVPGGQSVTPASWPVHSGTPQTVTVAAPQMTVVTKSFAADCALVSPPSSPGTSPSATPTPSSTSTPHVSAPHSDTSTGSGTSATSSGSSTSGSQSSAPSSSSLPGTGSSVSPFVVLAGVLLAGLGVLLLVVGRVRRRRA